MEQIHLYFCKSIFSDRFEHVTSKRSTDDTPAFWIFELLLQNDYKAETKGDEAENHPLSCNKDTKYGTERSTTFNDYVHSLGFCINH